MLRQVYPGLLDRDARHVDVVLRRVPRAHAEAGDRGVVHVDSERHRARSTAKLIVTLETDDARSDLEGQARAQVVPHGPRLEVRNFEYSARGERREAHGTVPHQPLTLRRGGFERIAITGRSAGAEVAQLEDDRLELGAKRCRSGAILEHDRAGQHRQSPDVQAWRRRGLLLRLGRRGWCGWEALAEIGEIQLAVRPNHSTHVRLLEPDVAEARTETPDRGELQRDAQAFERQESLPVRIR